MRTLRRNEVILYVVEPSGYTDEVDSDGNFTGEQILVRKEPYQVRISIYPNNGDIASKMFGTEQSFDYYSVSTCVDIPKNSLLYFVLPTTDFDTTFDFNIKSKQKSINGFSYGLVGNK